MQQDTKEIQSNYTGSKTTYQMVKKQIEERFGSEAAEQYNPRLNCLNYKTWLERGYMVKKGEKALKSVTYIKVKDEDGEIVRTYPKTVNLFFINQVERIKS